MIFNSVTSIESCYTAVQTNPALLYYSHIPTAIIVLLLGFFVYVKNRGGDSLASRVLLFIAIMFSLWSALDLIIWTSINSERVMSAWSIVNLAEMLVSAGTLYFAYVFIEKKDAPFKYKLLIGILLSLFAVFIPAKLNLIGFDDTNCEALQGGLMSYYHFLEAFFSLWLIVYLLVKIIKSEKLERRKIIYFSIGVVAFLASFSGTNIIASITLKWEILQYGLFGMVVFMAFLGYLIVKFKAFDIKLIRAQALVMALVALVGSMAFVSDITTVRIIIAITLLLLGIVGISLIRSVKLEVKRKEELQSLSDQLSDANDKLHQLDKAKSEFISIASHQLRTPLTSIKGFGSLLLEGTYGVVPEAQRGALEKIYISNERLIQLVEDLLNISRIEAGRMEFDFQEAQIEDLVNEAVMTLELSAKAKNLYLHWEKPAIAMPKLKIDITKIKEVISNMVDNSIKYTQKGGITVKLETSTAWDTEHKDHKESVRVVVSDTGIGMDQEEIEMIFEKFQRGKQVSHYHTDGTGLGMYIGKKIVAEHKGKIWAESDGKGKGSRFILELPVG